MKKLLKSITVAISMFVITGCGNKQESLVKEFYSVIQSKDDAVADRFFKTHMDEEIKDMLNSSEGRSFFGNVKREFGKISESKDSPKLKTLKDVTSKGGKGAVVEARCAGTTLYFVVVDEKIAVISAKSEVIDVMLRKEGLE